MSDVNMNFNVTPLHIKNDKGQSITVIVNEKGEFNISSSGNPIINIVKANNVHIGDKYNISVNSFEF